MAKRFKKTTKLTIAERRDKIIADIEAKIEGQLIIARHGDGWALIAKTNFWQDDSEDTWQDDPNDTPWVLCAGLQSEAAAEIALACARESYFDEEVRHPLGHDIPGEESTAREWYNAVGRILEVLRDTDSVSDISTPELALVARRAYWAALDRQSRHDPFDECECPF